jgi:hypothetical protein
MLATYNLKGTVHFPTRIINGFISAVCTFIDMASNYTISPLINGMADHDAQLIIPNNIFLQKRIVYFNYN